MNRPLVSIIVNCFNGEKYLNQCIQSIINQTYKNFEIIFWDNNSTDESQKIVSQFVDKRIKVFKTKCLNLHIKYINEFKFPGILKDKYLKL